jgi:hypothetical protein
MERELFQAIRRELRLIKSRRRSKRERFSDARIAEVYLWSVIHDRPVSWACVADHWADRLRPRALPSQSRMSRRLRTPSVKQLLDRVEANTLRRDRIAPVVTAVDGLPLPIGPHSHDPHATWGRGAGVKDRGYKLHLLLGLPDSILQWRVAALNVDEREMARRMLRDAQCGGYIVGDKNFDSNRLHDLARSHGGQLIVPRRRSHTSLGNGYQSAGRLRSKELLEHSTSGMGSALLAMRSAIERKFGYLTGTSGLLTHLPPWVRTHPRVRLWVQAKLILSELRTQLRHHPAAA